MLSVGSMLIRCICKKCEHEDTVWRSSSHIFETTKCPSCGSRTFSKKMFSPKIEEVTFRTIKSIDKGKNHE